MRELHLVKSNTFGCLRGISSILLMRWRFVLVRVLKVTSTEPGAWPLVEVADDPKLPLQRLVVDVVLGNGHLLDPDPLPLSSSLEGSQGAEEHGYNLFLTETST